MTDHHGNNLSLNEKEQLIYDDGTVFNFDNPRPCPRCLRPYGELAEDACLGRLLGVKSACCGHGKKEGYVVLNDGTRLTLTQYRERQ